MLPIIIAVVSLTMNQLKNASMCWKRIQLNNMFDLYKFLLAWIKQVSSGVDDCIKSSDEGIARCTNVSLNNSLPFPTKYWLQYLASKIEEFIHKKKSTGFKYGDEGGLCCA